jgi:chromosome segregation ATPase
MESTSGRSGEPSDHPEMAATIADLEEQLQASQAKIRDLENTREQLESRQKALEESRGQHTRDNIRLENELAAEKENRKLLEATQLRLSRVEQRHQELSEAHFQIQQENTELREHYESLWCELRERLEQLRREQAGIADKNRLVQEEILSLSNWLGAVPGAAPSPQAQDATSYDRNGALDPAADPAAQANLPIDGFDSAREASMEEEPGNQTQSIAAVRQVGNASASSVATAKKRRFGIFSAG